VDRRVLRARHAQRWGLEPPSGATHEEVRCLSEFLQLESGNQLLDIGCGHGRHAVAFGERGVSVTGLDGSAALLDQARELADRSGVAVAWVGLKVVNAEPILANFQSTGHEERAGAIVEISRTLTLDPPRVTERIVISGARGDGRYERRQRLYRIGDLSVVLGPPAWP
jgi:SAM-dependent methyltransferase